MTNDQSGSPWPRSDGEGEGEAVPHDAAWDEMPWGDGSSEEFGLFDDGDGDEVSTAAGAQRRLARRMLAGIGLLLLLVIGVAVVATVLHRQEPGVEYRYVIPHGTGERLAAGETFDVLPARIEMRTQDTLVIENQDHDAFTVGGLRVAPEQTMTYRFSEPGTYGGTCELHAGGSVDILVT